MVPLESLNLGLNQENRRRTTVWECISMRRRAVRVEAGRNIIEGNMKTTGVLIDIYTF